MRCIFCLKESDPSIEHVFPDAIGGTLTIDRVCKPCNDWLGAHVDALLTDHKLILMKRNQLAIKNRDGKVPAWEDIFGIATLTNEPDQRIKLTQDRRTGRINPKALYRETKKITEDGREEVGIVIGADRRGEVGKIVQRVWKRAGRPPLTPFQLAEEIEARVQEERIEKPEILMRVPIDIANYRKALCKIAYELAWLWLGDDYIDDPIASSLRNYILNGVESHISGHFDFGLVAPFDRLWADEPNAHIAFVQYSPGNGVVIVLRVFNVVSGGVVVTNSTELYPQVGDGSFFCCDPQTSKTRNVRFPDELLRVLQEKARANG